MGAADLRQDQKDRITAVAVVVLMGLAVVRRQLTLLQMLSVRQTVSAVRVLWL